MIRRLLHEYEEISILLGFLFLIFVAPLLHEMFHQIYLGAIGCQYRQSISLSIPVSASTEPLCHMERPEDVIYLLSGLAGSVIVSQILFLAAILTLPFLSLPIQAISSSILISNGMSLLVRHNDLSILLGQESFPISASVGIALILAGTAEFMFVAKRKEILNQEDYK